MTEMSTPGQGPLPKDYQERLAHEAAQRNIGVSVPSPGHLPDRYPPGMMAQPDPGDVEQAAHLGMRREDEGASQRFIETLQMRNDYLRTLLGRHQTVIEQVLGAQPEVVSPGLNQPAELPASKVQWIMDLLEENARLLSILEGQVARLELQL